MHPDQLTHNGLNQDSTLLYIYIYIYIYRERERERERERWREGDLVNI